VKGPRVKGNLARLATIMSNYALGSSFTTWTTDLKGEEVFGFAKCPTNFPFGVESDSHRLDRVNFCCLWVAIPLPQTNIVDWSSCLFTIVLFMQ